MTLVQLAINVAAVFFIVAVVCIVIGVPVALWWIIRGWCKMDAEVAKRHERFEKRRARIEEEIERGRKSQMCL